MGDRPSRYVLTGLAVLAGAGPAHATVQTTVKSSGSVSALIPYTPPSFDARLGTLVKVAIDADYEGIVGFTYPGIAVPTGYDHAVSGSSTFGGLSFGLAGSTVTTDYGRGQGTFAVSALGSGAWTSSADLARFTSGTTAGLFSNVQAIAPGTQMSSGGTAMVNYKVTYTFDDGTPAVPEPATWAMMAGGFVLIGAALRTARRRRLDDAAGAAAFDGRQH